MSSNYRGMRVMDPLDPPNIPTDIRNLVQSGPIPRFGSISERDAAMGPAYPGMLAAVGQDIYRHNGAQWMKVFPIDVIRSGGGNVGVSELGGHDLNRGVFLHAGQWRISATFAFDCPNGAATDCMFWVGDAGQHFNFAYRLFGSGSGSVSIGAGICDIGLQQEAWIWVNQYGGNASTYRGDIYADCINSYI